jgi:hypothetical protein
MAAANGGSGGGAEEALAGAGKYDPITGQP